MLPFVTFDTCLELLIIQQISNFKSTESQPWWNATQTQNSPTEYWFCKSIIYTASQFAHVLLCKIIIEHCEPMTKFNFDIFFFVANAKRVDVFCLSKLIKLSAKHCCLFILNKYLVKK